MLMKSSRTRYFTLPNAPATSARPVKRRETPRIMSKSGDEHLWSRLDEAKDDGKDDAEE